MRIHWLLLVLAGLAAGGEAAAQNRDRSYPPELPDAEAVVYKQAGDVELKLWLFRPEGHKPAEQRPASVFFFCGGWRSGTPSQFVPQCRYLASRGMVAATADYRVSSRHGVTADKCVQDAKSAIRYLRSHAAELGIDPERIAAGGGSAGGHLAACTGVVTGFEESAEDENVSSRPNLMVLFNPALVLAPVGKETPKLEARLSELGARLGVDDPAVLSPYHTVGAGQPAAIVFHGKADSTVDYRTAELFAEAMKKAGNACELVGYEGEGHGFFNYGRGGNSGYRDTLRRMDLFLAAHGYLEGEPTGEAAEKTE